MARLKSSGQLAMIADGVFLNIGNRPGRINARHARATRCNILFADGHAESLHRADLPTSFSLSHLATKPAARWRLDQ